MLVIAGLVVAIIIAGSERAKTDSQNRELREQNKQLQEKNKQLNKDLNAKIKARQVEKIAQANQTKRVTFVSPGKETIVSEIRRVFNNETAVAVCTSESGLNPTAVSPTGDYGVCQINLSAHWKIIPGNTREEKIASLFNYQTNIALAFTISNNGTNFNPWTDYRNGNYRRYL